VIIAAAAAAAAAADRPNSVAYSYLELEFPVSNTRMVHETRGIC